jgi:hypothetical protein
MPGEVERDKKAEAAVKRPYFVKLGPPIGMYLGEEIPEYIEDEDGSQYIFQGTTESVNTLEQIADSGVAVLPPGLIYRLHNISRYSPKRSH